MKATTKGAHGTNPKPRQNPLKMRNRAYLKGKAVKQSRKEGKGREKGTEHTQREGAGAHHLHSVDTTTAQRESHNGSPAILEI